MKAKGWDPVDPTAQDARELWTTTHTPSLSFRNHAIIHDVKALSEPGVALALLPGWNQYPEAKAMVAIAEVMGKQVVELSEEIFKEPECQES
jgi:hypothetical protein